MAEEHKGDGDDLGDKEARRNNRKVLKEVSEDMADNQQEMKNIHSRKFANMLKRYEEAAKRMIDPDTRELIAGATCLRHLTGAVKGQGQTLSDVSGRLSWQDLSASISNRFNVGGANGGLNWEKLGSEARQVFNTAPSFTTMVGPIHKEERVRKIAVRRQRENLSGVVNATSEKIVNEEEDGNDEATNARVANLLRHLESFAGQEFDLLRTLVDPVNPVQSVENFFDYSYLHKEKKVKDAFDEETGTLTACIADPGELDNAPKTQMVLSFSISDLKLMAKVLYPDIHGGDSSNDNHRSNRSSVSHPLHREDPLYDAADVEEQVRLLAKHTRQRQTQRGSVTPTPRVRNPLTSPQQQQQQQEVRSATQPTAGSNSAGKRASTGTSSGSSNATSKDTSRGASATTTAEQAQSSSSRRPSVGSSSSHASLHIAPPSTSTARSNVGVFNGASSSRRSSETYELEGVRRDGGSSSRHSVTLPANIYPSNGKGMQLTIKSPVCTSVRTPASSPPKSPGTACSENTAASAASGGQNYSSYSPISPPMSLQTNDAVDSGLSAAVTRTSLTGSVSTTKTAASAFTTNPPYTPVGSATTHRTATPGTASSTGTAVTAASVSPLVLPSSTSTSVTNGFDRATVRSAAAPAATRLSRIDTARWEDPHGRNRRAPPSPGITPTPPRVARAVPSTTTYSAVASSSAARFAPIAPMYPTESPVSLNSRDSSPSSTPSSVAHISGHHSTSKASLSTSGKRALDLEELRQTDPLSQVSVKRRAIEVTPVLPYTPGYSTAGARARDTEDVKRHHGEKEQDKQSGQSRGGSGQMEQTERSGQQSELVGQSRVTYRDSPESVQSERTENMFVSASDGDSDSSSY